MTKNDIKQIQETLSIIIGQPMRGLGRFNSEIYFNFGELVELDMSKVDEAIREVYEKDDKSVKIMVGEYQLYILCAMRFTHGDKIIFADGDVYYPIDEIENEPDFIWDNFKWHETGNNIFDEITARHFKGKYDDYIVKSTKVNNFGDLTISFENGYVMELFADGSDYGENWIFGKTKSTPEESLILTGRGIYTE